jgi:hypothetical protein
MESVRETAKKVWAAIIAAIKRAGEWLKTMWKRLTDSNVRLKERAEKQLKVIEGIDEGKKPQGKIENAGLAAKLAIDGKVADQYSHDFSVFGEFVAGMATKVVPNVVAFTGQTLSAIAANASGDSDLPFDSAKLKAAFAGVTLNDAGRDSDVDSGLDTRKSEQLPGGKCLVVQYPNNDGVEGAKAFPAAKMSIDLFKPELAKPKSAELPILSKPECSGIVKTVLGVSENIGKLRALEADFDKFIKGILASAVAMEKANEQFEAASKDGETKHKVRTKLILARAWFSRVTTRVSNLPAVVGSYALSTSKAGLDYVELSLKEYK